MILDIGAGLDATIIAVQHQQQQQQLHDRPRLRLYHGIVPKKYSRPDWPDSGPGVTAIMQDGIGSRSSKLQQKLQPSAVYDNSRRRSRRVDEGSGSFSIYGETGNGAEGAGCFTRSGRRGFRYLKASRWSGARSHALLQSRWSSESPESARNIRRDEPGTFHSSGRRRIPARI